MNYNELENNTILVTGATGLIGRAVINRLLQLYGNSISIIALIRTPEKAKNLFDEAAFSKIHWIVRDISDPINMDFINACTGKNIDYLIHTASQTASRAFVERPVETIKTALSGTENMLDLAKESHVKSLVYLSSMEVYGSPSTDEKITEKHASNLDPTSIRSSYPESKRMCESLCASYAAEFGVPAKIVRLTQTFGPGVAYDDSRVFAEFARCAIEKRDIVLNTKGETKRNYLYIEDAVDAILTVLLHGEDGQAYNAANEDTYCSIYDMAQMVSIACANSEIQVCFNETAIGKDFGYAPVLHMNLDTSKLRALGWEPRTALSDMFRNMIEDMKNKGRT